MKSFLLFPLVTATLAVGFDTAAATPEALSADGVTARHSVGRVTCETSATRQSTHCIAPADAAFAPADSAPASPSGTPSDGTWGGTMTLPSGATYHVVIDIQNELPPTPAITFYRVIRVFVEGWGMALVPGFADRPTEVAATVWDIPDTHTHPRGITFPYEALPTGTVGRALDITLDVSEANPNLATGSTREELEVAMADGSYTESPGTLTATLALHREERISRLATGSLVMPVDAGGRGDDWGYSLIAYDDGYFASVLTQSTTNADGGSSGTVQMWGAFASGDHLVVGGPYVDSAGTYACLVGRLAGHSFDGRAYAQENYPDACNERQTANQDFGAFTSTFVWQ
jgi:hypothetical protein